MNQDNRTIIGIDWADEKHDFYLVDASGNPHQDVFQGTPKTIAQQVKAWQALAPDTTLIIAIEATKGAIINALLEHPCIEIRLVNPAALASYRKAFAHGGGKNDPTDAMLLCQFLTKHPEQTRPLKPDTPLTRKLAALATGRRQLVDQRADLANQLTALVKAYFPAALELKPARSYSEFFLKFLAKYSTLGEAQAAGKTKLQNFFHGVHLKRKAEANATMLCEATPLTTDETTIQIARMRVLAVVEQLQTITKHIKGYEAALKKLVPLHERYEVARSLPHASTNTQARMIAAMGDGEGRYASAAQLHNASGISPITTQSGRHRSVQARWACSKFLRQTFHEYAGLAVQGCRWSKAFYDNQISKGKSVQMAKRALAYKWQRIIHRCWQTGEPYNEARYIEQLRKSGNPVYANLAPAV